MKSFKTPSLIEMKASKFAYSLSQISSYAFALFFMKGISILMLPIITRYLSPEEYGVLELITVAATLIAMLISASLHEALYRYVSSPDEDECIRCDKANQLFTLSCIISLVTSIGLTLAILFSSVSFIAVVEDKVLLIVLGSLAISCPLAIGLAWLRMQEKAKSFMLIATTTASLQAFLTIVFLELEFGVLGVVSATLISHSAQWLCVKQVSKLSLVRLNPRFSKQCLVYSVPLMLSGLVAFGLNGAERWFILANSSLETLGQYAIAAKFALATCILIQPFGMWWMPKRFTVAKQSLKQAERITQLGVAYICLLVVGIAVFAKLFVPYILDKDFQAVSSLIAGTLFMIIGKELVELLNLGLMLKNKSSVILRINLIVTLAALTLCYTVTTVNLGVWSIIAIVGAAQLFKALWVYQQSQREQCIFSTVLPMFLFVVTSIASLIAVYYADAWFELCLIALIATLIIGLTALKLFKPTINTVTTVQFE